MPNRLLQSLKIAIGVGLAAAVSIAVHPLIQSTSKSVDWPPVFASAGRAFAIYAALMFVLVFTGILKPRSKAGPSPKMNPLVWGILAVGAVAVAVWSLT